MYFFREKFFFDKLSRACSECYFTAVDAIMMCAEVFSRSNKHGGKVRTTMWLDP